MPCCAIVIALRTSNPDCCGARRPSTAEKWSDQPPSFLGRGHSNFSLSMVFSLTTIGRLGSHGINPCSLRRCECNCLRMLLLSSAAACACCCSRVLWLGSAAACECCSLRMQRLASAAACACSGLRVLWLAHAAACECCGLEVLQHGRAKTAKNWAAKRPVEEYCDEENGAGEKKFLKMPVFLALIGPSSILTVQFFSFGGPFSRHFRGGPHFCCHIRGQKWDHLESAEKMDPQN